MKLTPKDLRAIEIYNKNERQNLRENLDDFHLLVDTLIYLHEAIVEENTPVKYWQKDSETLFYKFTFHGLTLHQILSGLKLKSIYYDKDFDGKNIIDISSAKTVLRAQFEAFLMYHYIYINPIDDDLKELRYNAWIYSSLMQRQGFHSTSEFAKRQKANDLKELTKMKESISKLKSFKDLTIKQQKSLLENGSGKLFNHWATILKETGFSENSLFYTMYTMLSVYSHSEGLSIIQLNHKPDSTNNINNQAFLDLQHSKLLVCLMIDSLMKLYDAINKKYNTLTDQIKYDIEIYTTMAMKGME